jgi:hypothetical protein
VGTPDPTIPRVANVVYAGRKVLFVEAMSLPHGSYEIDSFGRVCCDGVYIGQSIAPLLCAVRHWRSVLPWRHEVGALVVVYRTGDNDPTLPPSQPNLNWVTAAGAVDFVERWIPDRPRTSTRVLGALVAATRY